MRARWWLALSAAVNLALASALYKQVQMAAPPNDVFELPATNAAASSPFPRPGSVVVRRQFFHWSQIESDDYPTFVANLRAIGCPELTVRDIIIADVNQLFAQRRAVEIVPSDTQWWKSEPDLDQTDIAIKKQMELETERTTLLAKLLGPTWNVNFAQPSEIGSVPLNGPVLGKLDPEVKLKVQELAVTSARQVRAYITAQQAEGKAIDPAQMARLRSEHRQELAKVLAPEQLEEYLLRHSANADFLRQQLKGFAPTPEEFRAIFRARDQFDNNIQLHYTGDDPASVRTRQETERIRDDAVATALGPERAALYRATSDPLFREAQFIAEQSGATPEKVLPLYQIQVEGARERARIASDAKLTAVQRATALRAVEVEEEAARRKLLGLPPEGETQ